MAESDTISHTRPADKYEALPEAERFIDAGRFRWVKKVRRASDGKIIACESVRYQDSETSKTTAAQECAILKQLKHPNVIEQIEVEWWPNKLKIYMEYYEGGSLQDLIDEHKEQETNITELNVWRILNQLASALIFCYLGLRSDRKGRVSNQQHSILDWKMALHRDVKPANVFLRNRSNLAFDAIRLGDFGLSYVLQNNAAPETYAGTRQYMAPEVSQVSVRVIHWTEHCDIFSLGCTVYALCALEPPFDYHMEADSNTYPLLSDRYSIELGNCIASCLSFYAENRSNAIRLFQQSQHHLTSLRKRQSQHRLTETLETQREVIILNLLWKSLDFPDSEPSASWGQDQILAFDLHRSIGVLAERATPASIKTIAVSTTEVATQIHWNARHALKGHSARVWAVAFSPDGQQIASASGDATVRLWDSATGAARGTLEGHSDGVYGVAFSSDGKQIASASGDKTVKLWDSAAKAAALTEEKMIPKYLKKLCKL